MKHNKLARLPFAIAFSLACGQSALADTFNFRFGLPGAATAVGSFTTSDSTTGSLAGAFNNPSFANLSALNVTVSGASAGNGSFTLADFTNIYFRASSALDFSQNLVGQAALQDFNLFGSPGPAPVGTSIFTLTSNNGADSPMVLSCFALSSVLSACSTSAPQEQLQTNSANETAVNDFNRSVYDSISNRLHRTKNERGLTPALAQQSFDTSLMLADNSPNAGAGLGELAGSGQYGLWVQAFGSKSKQDLHANYAGFDADTNGVTIGADALVASDWVVGSAFSYGRTDVNQQDYLDGDSSDIDTYQLTAYTSRDFGLWYLDGMLGYAQQKYDTNRNTTGTDIAKGKFDGEQLLAKVEAGYPIALTKQLTLTPLAGLEWNRLELDSYREKDAGAQALQVKGEHTQRTASNLGARLEMAIDLEHGAVLYPSTHARWVHQFDNDGIDTTAAFIGGGGSFVSTGQKLAEDSYIAGVGLTLQQASGSSVSLQLDTEQATARSGFSGQVAAQWLF